MKQGIGQRLALVTAVLIVGLIYLLPSIPQTPDALRKYLPDNKISLGLDLMGGIYFELGLDTESALSNALFRMGSDIRSKARESEIVILRTRLAGKDKLTFVGNLSQQAALDMLLATDFPQLEVLSRTPDDERIHYTLAYTESAKDTWIDEALDHTVRVITSRIDQFGVAEPDIRKQSSAQRIQVQLPGMSDIDRAIALVGRTARLEFRIADPSLNPNGVLPMDSEVLPYSRILNDGSVLEQPLVVEREALFTGEHIKNAYSSKDEYGAPAVAMEFTPYGADLFARITGENKGKALAIVLDGRVHSAPGISKQIIGDSASITGQFSLQETIDLALLLRSGALPTPVEVMGERTVGPSLGQESIDKGVTAALAGWALIIVFIAIYYGRSGLIADAMLVLDIVLLLAAMALLGATLTLPGIAGIVLTIGMAVDANVLIFERIREELRKGSTTLEAINLGFARATTTILDSNITTIIAAAILYQFGTGPIRGFAITLMLGVAISMFTAIYVARLAFDIWMGDDPKKELSI